MAPAAPEPSEMGGGKSVSGIIEARGLSKRFQVKRAATTRSQWLRAVDNVDFSVSPSTVFALVGESGCGKSTVARLLLKLIGPTKGDVLFKGRALKSLDRAGMRAFRRAVQIVFQDPFASLNPRRTVFDTLAEPMKIHGLAAGAELRDKVAALLGTVGLKDVMDRYPHEFSGGQRQRICIARALAVSPEVIVADEPLSSLDVSIQAQILNLLEDLRGSSGISFVFISHDLRVVEYFSDEVAVMYLGRIVEQAPTGELFTKPLHPYTVILLASAPGLKPGGRKKPEMGGEVPSPIDLPPGCPFHPRCPRRFEPCDQLVPELLATSDHPVACHLWNPFT